METQLCIAMHKLEAQAKKMEGEIEVLCKENETLKQKPSGSKENEHIKAREHDAKKVDTKRQA